MVEGVTEESLIAFVAAEWAFPELDLQIEVNTPTACKELEETHGISVSHDVMSKRLSSMEDRGELKRCDGKRLCPVTGKALVAWTHVLE